MALVAASCLFLAAMVHAAVADFRHDRAWNLTVVALAVGYVPLAMAVGLELHAVVSSLVAAVLVFAIGFGGFCAGLIDGPEVKLVTVATLWIGAELVVPFLALAGLFALGLAVLFSALRRWQTGEAVAIGEMPYNPGIVLAAIVLFTSSQWFAIA